MLLSRNPKERHAQYRNLIRECGISREDRQGANRRLRQIALTGSDTIQPALYNMIFEFVRDANADILAPDNIQFSVVTPPHYGSQFIEECEAARVEFHRLWHDTDAGLLASMAGFWARVYGCMVGKVLTDRDEATLMLVPDPSDIGVLNEGISEWDRQEAIVHWYELDLAAFRRMIYPITDDKFRERVWREAIDGAQPPTGGDLGLGPAMAGIILSAVSPNVTGTANLRGSDPARARVADDVVRLAELWVWDDESVPLCEQCRKPLWALTHDPSMTALYNHDFKAGGGWEGDYRVVTVLLSSQTEPIIKEPPNPLIAGEHCFHGLTLHPAPGYIWGLSQVEQMYPLQEKSMEVLGDIFDRLGKQADPPMVATGVQGIIEEKLKNLRKRGGMFPVAMPGAKVEPFIVPMPPEAFSALEELRKMFDRLGGRRSRQREPGMRSGDQVMTEATLAGGPLLEEAKRAQQWLEGVATQKFRLHRRTSRQTLKKYNHEEGKETDFLLSQIPGESVVRIEANSSSPIHRQEILAKVAFAAQRGWLDGDDGIRLLALPYEHSLTATARRRAKAQGQMQEEMLKMKKEEADAKLLKAQASANKP